MSRSEAVRLKVSRAELRAIDRAADRAGLDRSSWIRTVCTHASGDRTLVQQLERAAYDAEQQAAAERAEAARRELYPDGCDHTLDASVCARCTPAVRKLAERGLSMPPHPRYQRTAIGQAIHDARERRGWSLEETAARLDIGKSYLHDLEHGRRPITADLADRIARTLRLPRAGLDVCPHCGGTGRA